MIIIVCAQPMNSAHVFLRLATSGDLVYHHSVPWLCEKNVSTSFSFMVVELCRLL